MKILSISAQKPMSTGSGVYLTELVRVFDKMGCDQAVLAGVYADDFIDLPESVSFYPVYFNSSELPFPIVGMSDEMPYQSTRYSDMTDAMLDKFERAFVKVLDRTCDEFNPDLIICHHLYYLTAIVREHFPNKKVFGLCHNTDIRQMEKNDIKRDFVIENIKKLDRVISPQKPQSEKVMEIYGVEASKILQVGTGYNSDRFICTRERELMHEKFPNVTRIMFVGKIAQKKGIISLLRSLNYLNEPVDSVEINLVGGAGEYEEYEEIKRLAAESKYKVNLLGRVDDEMLVKMYNQNDIFVLPSFFDSIALTLIEALACGLRLVCTDLPGVPEWLDKNVDNADIRYVELPRLKNADEADPTELPAFEKRLAAKISESINVKDSSLANVSRISWSSVAEKILAG